MKSLFLITLTLLSGYGFGQRLISLNTRLEFLTSVSNCAGSPDQCPRWGTTIAPFSGNYYLGIHEMNYTNSGEAISVRLSAPLVTDTTYTYTVMAAIAPITAWGGAGNGDRDGVIYVYGGSAACATTQLIDSITLFTPADRNNWRQFTFNFTASGNHTYLSFLSRKVTLGGYSALSYMVLDDAIRYDFSDAPDTYKTLLASNGARHQMTGAAPPLLIGYSVDGEEDGFPGTTLTGDDSTGLIDDEDGFVSLPDLNQSQTYYSLNNILVKNSTGKTAYLAGWIDFNKNDVFESSEAAVVPVPSSGAQSVSLNWSGFTVSSGGTSYARFRISTDTTILNPVASLCKAIGLAADGEVEDYKINISNCALVNAPPDTSICIGGNILLEARGASNFNWSPATGLSCTNCANPVASPDSTTTYIVTGSSAGGCLSSDTMVVTVNPKLPVQISPRTSAICEGDNVPLSISGATGVSWLPATGLNCTNCISPVASPTITTTYFAYTGPGTCAGFDSATIVVYPKPDSVLIHAQKPVFCANDSAELCAPPGFVAYQWNTGGQNACEWAKYAGNYYLTVTDINGCTAQSNRQSISVYPISPVSIVVQGDTLSSFGAVSYQWLYNDTEIPGGTSPVYVAKQSGTYSLRIVDANGCTSTSTGFQVIKTSLEEQADEASTLLFTNPVKNSTLQLNVAKKWNGYKLTIHNSCGQLVFEERVSGEQILIDIAALPAGVYLLQVNSVVKKMVISR